MAVRKGKSILSNQCSTDTFCSMSWLKRQLKRLGLMKCCPDPPEETIKTLIA